MITLSALIIIATILGWVKRYIDSKNGLYTLNIFKSEPETFTVLLLIGTVVSLCLIIFLCIKYLP
jgi:preprotein translocase subunit SecY